MRAFSIKRRIVTAVVVTELVLVLCLLLLSGYLIRRSSTRSFEDTLQGRAMSMAALVRYTEGPQPELQFDSTPMIQQVTAGAPDLFQIETQDGRVLASSMTPPKLATSTRNRNGVLVWEFFSNGVPYRAVQLPNVPVLDSEEAAPKNSVTLKVTYAATTRGLRKSLKHAFILILGFGMLLLAISVYASVKTIERGLRPLSALVSSANAISAADWDLKLNPSVVSVVEISPLAAAMSRMLESLHAAFDQQRDFTSNAAHELKTPVAILKSTLQSLLQEPRAADIYRSGISDALSDLARLETLLHSMLRLARAEQQTARANVGDLPNIDIVATCEAAIARLTPLAQTRGTVISLSAPNDALPVRAEPEDLEIIWTNVLENAIRYSPPKSEVKVTATRQNGFALVVVEDSGPGISPMELRKIFDRFHRGDQSRSRESGGYGLGLAIAKAFVDRYGGSITASAVAPSGTRILIEFPTSN